MYVYSTRNNFFILSTSNTMDNECYRKTISLLLAISLTGVIIFTLFCGFTYDIGMSDKYGGLRYSTIYSANITNYVVCDTGGYFDRYQPVDTFNRYGELVNCMLYFSGGNNDDNCRSNTDIRHMFPYGSELELYLNTEKTPYCVTKDYLEENAYLGFQFLITDMVFLVCLILTTTYACIQCGNCNCKPCHSSTNMYTSTNTV
jgi:hypothetical protein